MWYDWDESRRFDKTVDGILLGFTDRMKPCIFGITIPEHEWDWAS
jgi:hypothetical protein